MKEMMEGYLRKHSFERMKEENEGGMSSAQVEIVNWRRLEKLWFSDIQSQCQKLGVKIADFELSSWDEIAEDLVMEKFGEERVLYLYSMYKSVKKNLDARKQGNRE